MLHVVRECYSRDDIKLSDNESRKTQFLMVKSDARGRFELPYTAPKAVVLPLDDRAIF